MVLLISFLTIGVYVIFFVSFYKAIKLVKQHLGFGYVLGLVLGLFALLMNKSQEQGNKKLLLNLQYPSNVELRDLYNNEITIEKNLFHHIDLNLAIGKIRGTDSLVVSSAAAFMNGMHIGTTWSPNSISLFPIQGTDSARYLISAMVNNRFLIFSNDAVEDYTGTISLKKPNL
jgi:hypothetical protein